MSGVPSNLPCRRIDAMSVSTSTIQAERRPVCYLCGSDGDIVHRDLRDRLFGAPGQWRLRRCASPSCGLMWLDPMPTRGDVGKAYIDYYTHADQLNAPARTIREMAKRIYFTVYARLHEDHLARRYGYPLRKLTSWQGWMARLAPIPFVRARMDFSVMYLSLVANGRLLEVGCGNGRMLRDMQSFGWQVYGVDFDEAAVAKAREKGLQVAHGDLHSQRYPDDHFDAIVMSHVIEHVHEPSAILQECHRILKPGGRLVMVTPNSDGLGHRLFGANWRGLEPPRHLHIFNVKTLTRLLDKERFIECEVKSTVRDANGMLAYSMLLRRGLSRHGIKIPLFVHVAAKLLQAFEYLALGLGKQLGEEIAAIGRKPPRQKSVSVALCTYNGERYLKQQLESINTQTRLPNEVVICDDGSTDGTLEIVDEYARNAACVVTVMRNERRLGSTKNFEKAISLCAGEIIVLCDQDDVWRQDKIQTLMSALSEDVSAVFSNAEVVDEKLNPLGYSLWQKVRFTRRARKKFRSGEVFETLVGRNVVTGATMAFRRDVIDLFTPMPESWVHDGWIALCLAAAGKKIAFIDELLITYRQHAGNQLGARKLKLLEHVRRGLKTNLQADLSLVLRQYMDAYAVLSQRFSLSVAQKQLLERKVRHIARRQSLCKKGWWLCAFVVMNELVAGRYYRYSNGWRTAARDLAMRFYGRGV